MHRNSNVVFLRLIAALMVLSGHMSYIIGGAPSYLWGQPIHGMGIKIFFLLGGVFITKSWISDPNPMRYMVKRFFRIWPPLAFFIIVVAFLIGPLVSSCSAIEYYSSPILGAYLRNLRLYISFSLPGVFENNPYSYAVNGSLWSLPVEVLMYAVIPIVVSMLSKLHSHRGKSVGAWCITAVVCGMRIYCFSHPEMQFIAYATDWIGALDVISFYCIGMAFEMSKGEKYLNFPLSVFFMLLFSCINPQKNCYLVIFYFAFSYFILSLAFAAEISIKKYSIDKWEISYGMYLWGFFLQQLVVWIMIKFNWNINFFVAFLASTILSLIAGYISLVVVERPTRKICKILLSKMK